MRVLAVSDLHVDYEQNMAWCSQLCDAEYRNDVLVVAGDISHKLDLLEKCLNTLKSKFKQVFFSPGNHDLWVTAEGENSIEKLEKVFQVCERVGVKTRTEKIEGVWFVPIASWYHASWDREEDWVDVLPPRKVMADFRACKWPKGLALQKDSSIAELFDSFNDPELQNLETVLEIERESAFESACPVISFSHFLPRNELIPEKSKLFYKALPKAVGSDYLRRRIDDLKPDIHIFGHTHFSYDCYLDNVRYVQWPLAYPKEQERRRKYGVTNRLDHQPPSSSDSKADSKAEDYDAMQKKDPPHPFRSWKPIVVYDSSQGGVTECRPTYWCNYYGMQTCRGKGGLARRSAKGKGPPAKPIAKQLKSSLRL
jgi:Icc-related predicted phosphoesterase